MIFNISIIIFFSEVVLGEHIVGKDPDCNRKKTKCNPPKITRRINASRDIIIHENYKSPNKYSNDIALIRINEAIPLFQENPAISAVSPICLPWSRKQEFAWNLLDSDPTFPITYPKVRMGTKKCQKAIL